MPKRDQSFESKNTPGGVITGRAFNYACSFYDFANQKYPELKQYPPEKARGTLLQTAIIVSTLIMLERRSGGAGRNELHDDVSRSFAHAVRQRKLSAVQDLSCFLLQLNRGDLKADAIPSFAGLANVPDEKLVNSIGVWLALAVAKKPKLEEPDLKIAAAMGRSAWTSATMIVRMLQPKPTS
ncbi:MAG: hypothetical protein HY925_04930 [Elusimicrobia bacterium]|nr:hypothetical protein [Elusimicrobiota bacterium]